MSTNNSSLLRNALLGNSIFSFISGLGFVLFSNFITSFLGLSASWVILALGVGLIFYGWQIYSAVRKESINTEFAKFAIYSDLIWVVLSAILIFTGLVAFTTPGKWAIAIIADIVLVFAVLQYVGLRRMTK